MDAARASTNRNLKNDKERGHNKKFFVKMLWSTTILHFIFLETKNKEFQPWMNVNHDFVFLNQESWLNNDMIEHVNIFSFVVEQLPK